MNNIIDTARFSAQMRNKAIKRDSKQLLVAKLGGTSQEDDLTEPVNCGGVGRIRHFRRATAPGWPENPLPIDPAAHKLGLPNVEVARAQVFQNAACNWRCWYCYVPFGLLKGDEQTGLWTTADELINRYADSQNPPEIIDLSGGQPDLTPEWIPWTMDALERGGLSSRTFLWSDDNLSTDYFWTMLSTAEIDRVAAYRNYGKVGCFKGFDASSFSFNTRADPKLFDAQFSIFERIVRTGIDVYGYATFTSADGSNVGSQMIEFVDRLQSISRLLPLRVVPLKVATFRPVETENRAGPIHQKSMEIQEEAIQHWNAELEKRFTIAERGLPIYDVAIR
jgi:uncharacterized Fe-S cluster-containing radical SAM superfamily protein